IGGTVSPAGGNFEEPGTQATLKGVGAFHGLSRERSDARKNPAIHPLDSWSKYQGIMPAAAVQYAHSFLRRGAEVGAMMKVVGEEGTSLEDYVVYLKGEFLDAVYLQQNSFDPVDAAVPPHRQKHVFALVLKILAAEIAFAGKEEAREFFYDLRQTMLDLNGTPESSDMFSSLYKKIEDALSARKPDYDARGLKAIGLVE
ncbi:MAG: V-type ATP synthase subunit A, partial [Rectinema sp.]|nr:V-type ATP synthase subunit A [Rectinema sp.]